jgi:hypothetical protein
VVPSLLIVVGGAAACGGGAYGRPDVTPAASDTLVGTVRSVNYTTETVEVLTGFGSAVRLERVRVAPAVPVRIGGARRPLADLRRGQVVRIVYRETRQGKTAASLEVVTRPARGGRDAR